MGPQASRHIFSNSSKLAHQLTNQRASTNQEEAISKKNFENISIYLAITPQLEFIGSSTKTRAK